MVPWQQTGQVAATERAEELPPATTSEEVEQLLNRWRRDNTDRTRYGLSVQKALLASVVLFWLGLMLPIFMTWHSHSRYGGYLLLRMMSVSLVGLVLPWAGLAWRMRRPRRITATQGLIQAQVDALEDVQAIGPLLDALYASEPLRETVLSALTRLLPRLPENEETAGLLRSRAHALYPQLNALASSHPDFVLAVLRLLPCIADRRALVKTVQLMTNDSANPNAALVREAAYEMLPRLLARVDLGGVESLAGWIGRLKLQTIAGAYSMPNLAVMQLLPQTDPADYLELDSRLRQNLYHNLRVVDLFQGQYALVVLDMIRRSADVDALATVRALSEHRPAEGPMGHGTWASPYQEVFDAALECIPILEEQLDKERARTSLLRGTSIPPAAPETLLRATANDIPTDPQLLLRATSQDVEATRDSSKSRDRAAQLVYPENTSPPAPSPTRRGGAGLSCFNVNGVHQDYPADIQAQEVLIDQGQA
jgi:hypothetical protein